MWSTALKITSIWLFLLVFSVLNALSAIDEINRGSSFWFVAIDIIVPALVVLSIVIHGLFLKPVRHRRFWKLVPFSYAMLILWDFFSNFYIIVKMNVLIVIVLLSIQLLAFYLSFEIGFSKKNSAIDPMSPQLRIFAFRKRFISVTMVLSLSIFLFVFFGLPLFTTIDGRDPDAISNTDIKNAFTTSQAYFIDHPNGSITIEVLESYGFRGRDGVTINLIGTSSDDLAMTAMHQKGYIEYHINKQGTIKKSYKKSVLGYIKINFPTLWHILRFWGVDPKRALSPEP